MIAHPDQAVIAGSIRRKSPTVRDGDVLLVDVSPGQWSRLERLPRATFTQYGPVRAQLVYRPRRFKTGLQIDVRRVARQSLGAALEYFTGPRGHNLGMRSKAKSRGMKLNEYGLFDVRTGERLAGETEKGIYEVLDHPWKPPELRGR